MKNSLVSVILIIILSSIFVYLFTMKVNENTLLVEKLKQYKKLEEQLKIKYLDFEHLAMDTSSQIKFQKNQLNVLNEFILNFYFGNQSSKKSKLLEFFNNKKQFTVFKKGNNIVVGNIMFVYQDNTLVSLMVYD